MAIQLALETEAFAICDTMRYIKPPIHTICLGSAMGMAAWCCCQLERKGCRASLPNATIILNQPKSYAQGQATDIQIRARSFANKAMIDILSRNTGQNSEKIAKDMDRLFYITPSGCGVWFDWPSSESKMSPTLHCLPEF